MFWVGGLGSSVRGLVASRTDVLDCPVRRFVHSWIVSLPASGFIPDVRVLGSPSGSQSE